MQELWKDVKTYIGQKYQGLETKITPINIVVNTITVKGPSALNFICLIVKQHIYILGETISRKLNIHQKQWNQYES